MTDEKSSDRWESGDARQSARSLRERVEEMLATPFDEVDSMFMDGVRRLLHELDARQLELEIQNAELREAQVVLSYARDRFADLYEFAPVGYVTLDQDGAILEANLTAAIMLGVDRQDLLMSHLSRFAIRESQDECSLHRQAVFSSDEKQITETELRKADGMPLVVRLESIAFDGEGQRRCRTALIDITTTHSSQEQLAASEQRYRRLTDAVIDYIFTVRVENGGTAETIHGPNCEAVTGYTPDEFAANTLLWISIVPEEDRPLVEQHVRQTLIGERPAPLEHRIRRKDGVVRWVLRVASPHFDKQGRLISYDGLLRDITERKEADVALQDLNISLDQSLTDRTTELQKSVEQINLFGEAIAHLGEGVMITSDHLDWPGPQIVFVNKAMCRITGYTADELIGQTPRILQGNGSDRETLDRIKGELSAGDFCRTELTNYRKDGTSYDAELFITPLFNIEGRRTNFVAIHRDISERKRAEQKLHDREERLAAILNTASDAIITIDRRGIIEGVNPATEMMFGFAKDELIGQNVRLLMPPPHADEHNDYVTRYVETGEARIIGTGRELIGQRKDGSIFPMDLSVSEVDHLGLFAGIVRDISERKRLEQEVLEIAESERLAIGQDLHDDLGQRLSGIGMTADALAMSLSRQSELSSEQDLARQIQQGLKHATSQVRTLAYGLVPVDVTSRSLANALNALAMRFNEPDGVECLFDCPDEVDFRDNQTATHLFRIAQEAATNAVRHSSAKRIWISLEKINGRLILRIHDDGTGFDTGSGTHTEGLGVRSMEYRASQIGAQLTIQSAPGEGTTVICAVLLKPAQLLTPDVAEANPGRSDAESQSKAGQ